MNKHHPIGFFDSGSGGLSVLAAFRQAMPRENCLYFGDHAHLPYGTKPTEIIRELTIKACDGLAEQGVKALVVACNTVSTAALPLLQKRYPFPVLGVEPALAEATRLCPSGAILVMATPATIASPRFKAISAPHQNHFIPLPCPGLADAVESEDESVQIALLKKLFSSLDKRDICAIVLGCTHYPLIKNAIVHVFNKPVLFVDGYGKLARTLHDTLGTAGLLNEQTEPGKITLSTSGGEETKKRLQRILERHTNFTLSDNQGSV
ncbi:MAG: glutamate racemase [Christensenellales bacterium]|jgi:glutamate racemase